MWPGSPRQRDDRGRNTWATVAVYQHRRSQWWPSFPLTSLSRRRRKSQKEYGVVLGTQQSLKGRTQWHSSDCSSLSPRFCSLCNIDIKREATLLHVVLLPRQKEDRLGWGMIFYLTIRWEALLQSALQSQTSKLPGCNGWTHLLLYWWEEILPCLFSPLDVPSPRGQRLRYFKLLSLEAESISP